MDSIKKEQNEFEEKKRIITMTAKIIIEGLHKHVFDKHSYPQPESMLESLNSVVLETLKVLIKKIT